MAASSAREVTQLLRAWGEGDELALTQLVPLVEAELHRLAQIHLRGERANHTLQATALVNEAYLRLVDWKKIQKDIQWESRAQFFGLAAKLMRHVLVDYARQRSLQKRGGDAIRISLSEADAMSAPREADLIALND